MHFKPRGKRVTLSTWFKKKVSIEDYAQTLAFEQPEESALFEAVMALPKKYRQIMHLYYYEDYSASAVTGSMQGSMNIHEDSADGKKSVACELAIDEITGDASGNTAVEN